MDKAHLLDCLQYVLPTGAGKAHGLRCRGEGGVNRVYGMANPCDSSRGGGDIEGALSRAICTRSGEDGRRKRCGGDV